jgi:hypothetical protein
MPARGSIIAFFTKKEEKKRKKRVKEICKNKGASVSRFYPLINNYGRIM